LIDSNGRGTAPRAVVSDQEITMNDASGEQRGGKAAET
jgi:hypothetical protein